MLYTLEQKDKLTEYLIKAIAIHLMVLIMAVVLNTIFSLNLFQNHKKDNDVKVVQSAVRIDVVDLPKMTLQELKKMNLIEKTEVIKPEEVKKSNETSDIEFKKKAKKLDLSSVLGKYSAKKVKRIKKKKTKQKINSRELEKLVLEGNKISAGSSTTGQKLDASEADLIRYAQALPDKVKQYWKLPSYLIDKGLQCRIRIFIASNGNITKMNIIESSGDNEFDKKALEAVKNSSPLPKPASTILRQVTNGEVVLGFPL